MADKRKNVVLIGMPGAGKSTIGVLLAKSLLMEFQDTDLVIQKKCKKSLCDIMDEVGVEAFIEKENEIIKSCDFENSVVATGGSAVYGKEAMERLSCDEKLRDDMGKFNAEKIKDFDKNIVIDKLTRAFADEGLI